MAVLIHTPSSASGCNLEVKHAGEVISSTGDALAAQVKHVLLKKAD